VSALCPRCQAPLILSDANWLPTAEGYLPALEWSHQRPDGAGWCRSRTGPPAGYTDAPAYGKLCAESDTLASVPAAPGRAA
jgi:hypothetical protein